MVGIGIALIASRRSGSGSSWWRRRDIPQTQWFLRAVAVSGVAAVVALEAGWIVTEVGRQPWIVYEVMRTEEAVTGASGVWVTFAFVLVALRGARGRDGRGPVVLRRRWRDAWREADEPSPSADAAAYGRRSAGRPGWRREEARGE